MEAISFVILGLTYMDALPPVEKILAMLACVFFVTLGSYGFNSVTDFQEDSVNKPLSQINTGRKTWRDILNFSLACKLLAVASAYFISWAVLAAVSIILLGSFFYSSTPLGGGRLKDMLIIKNITIALLWSVLLLLPMLAWGASIPLAFLAVVFFVFTHDFISSVLSDLKDVEGDRQAGIKTFPSVYGERNTLALLASANILGLAAILAGWMFLGLKPYLFLLPLACASRAYMFSLIYSKRQSAAEVYRKLDRPTETALGPLALVGRLLVH
ncbi:MAG: UbiA family prenyltransferase [Candidatus Micrarchaeia archaeon]